MILRLLLKLLLEDFFGLPIFFARFARRPVENCPRKNPALKMRRIPPFSAVWPQQSPCSSCCPRSQGGMRTKTVPPGLIGVSSQTFPPGATGKTERPARGDSLETSIQLVSETIQLRLQVQMSRVAGGRHDPVQVRGGLLPPAGRQVSQSAIFRRMRAASRLLGMKFVNLLMMKNIMCGRD